MNIEDIKKLDNGELTIKVAECCGWKFFKVSNEFKYTSISPTGKEYYFDFGEIYHLPDYCNDLNAMHEAEKLIPMEKQREYAFIVAGMWDELWSDSTDTDKANGYWDATYTTARQRAEAFVLTMEA